MLIYIYIYIIYIIHIIDMLISNFKAISIFETIQQAVSVNYHLLNKHDIYIYICLYVCIDICTYIYIYNRLATK